MRRVPVLLGSIACLIVAVPTLAKDKGHGHGHGHGHVHGNAAAPKARVYVTERDRSAVYTFYRTDYVSGRCPPGLARKDIGCLPPGQARKVWAIGAPLPPSVVFYPLPAALLAQLTPAPEGYQYVRVDNDVLLLTLGTRVVAEPVGNLADLREDRRPLVSGHDRDAIAAYFHDDYLAGNCPTGLVRTELGCEPRRLWALGEPLDPAATYEPLPQPLLAQLDPVPAGYTYIRLGEHILLMIVESRIVSAHVVDLSRAALLRPAMALTAPLTAPRAVVVPERIDYVGGGRGCPPGLAKKNNGCLPPGHAK